MYNALQRYTCFHDYLPPSPAGLSVVVEYTPCGDNSESVRPSTPGEGSNRVLSKETKPQLLQVRMGAVVMATPRDSLRTRLMGEASGFNVQNKQFCTRTQRLFLPTTTLQPCCSKGRRSACANSGASHLVTSMAENGACVPVVIARREAPGSIRRCMKGV